MPRIRTLKPEFWSNEKLASLTFPARLLAIALLNYADDEGFFNANPRLVEAFAFPLDQGVKIPVLLRELSGIGYVCFREASGLNDQNGSGTTKTLGFIPGFVGHQYVSKPKASALRPFWEASGLNDGTRPVRVPEHSAQEGNGMEQGMERKGRRFAPPSVAEVREHAGPSFDAEAFVAFYESKGWRVGNTPMKSWKAAVVTWQKRDSKPEPPRVVIHKSQADLDREREGDEIARNREAAAKARYEREMDDLGWPDVEKTR